jgi:hypothetical protein
MRNVKAYDLSTKKTSTIPEDELAPGMILAQVEGVGLVWVNASQVKKSGYKHPPLKADMRAMINERIRTLLKDVYPLSLDFLKP